MSSLKNPGPIDVQPVQASLRVSEIFYSLQGEARTAGAPTVFIRLTGCPLRCRYCDTEYAFTGGERMAVTDIIERVSNYGASLVTVTGGEPLAQKDVQTLLTGLCNAGYQVSLETGGSLDIRPVDPRVSVVLDIKTPGSGESQKNLLRNLEHIHAKDQIKFVICDRADYEWSREFLQQHKLSEICDVWFSPSFGEVDPGQMADWILQDHLPVRLQLQLHKLLWGDERGR